MMNIFRKVTEAIVEESSDAKIRRIAVGEIKLHAQALAEFKAEALKAGFTEFQVEVMAKYLSMSTHYHQYFNGHWTTTTQPVTSEAELLQEVARRMYDKRNTGKVENADSTADAEWRKAVP